MEVGGITPASVTVIVAFLEERIQNYERQIEEAAEEGYTSLVFGYRMRVDGFKCALECVQLLINGGE